MTITTDDVRRMERLHVRAWPALETAWIDGWLWRYSGGGSNRANSVSTVDFAGSGPAAALDQVEARYRAKGVPARVQTFDASKPSTIAGLLRSRGYEESEATTTMWKPVASSCSPTDVEATDVAGAEWREVYLGAITENRRAINARILDGIPAPRAYFACRRDGRVISTALGVADDGLAVVECMATRPEARRQGGAEAVLRALEVWASAHGAAALGLQVVTGNAPALKLYTGFGFGGIATNRFWVSH